MSDDNKIINGACHVLSVLSQVEGEYEKINNQLRHIQGDFYSHLSAMNERIETSLMDLLDLILCHNASYLLYDNGGKVIEQDGTEHEIKCVEDVRRYALIHSPFAIAGAMQ